MFSIFDNQGNKRVNRRELLRVGGLSALGVTLPMLLEQESRVYGNPVRSSTFGKAKNVIFLWLQGATSARDIRPKARCASRYSRRV